MSIDFSKLYHIDSSYEKRVIMDRITYTNFDIASWVRVNQMGEDILSKIDGKTSLNDIINSICDEYSMPKKIIVESCTEFLEKVIDLGLIYAMNEEEIIYDRIDMDTEDIYPSSIWIHITGRCNLNCVFCYSKSGRTNEYILKMEEIKSFLEQIPTEHRNEIVISGGEPFTHPNFVEIIIMLKETLGYKAIRLITNGTVGHTLFSKIATYIDSIQFSVDGPRAEIHDQSRGAGSFEKMLCGINEAKKAGIKNIMISFTQTVDNYQYLKDMPLFMKENGIYRLHITKLMPVGRGRQSAESLSITQEMFNQELDAFYEEYLKVLHGIRMDREVYDVGLPLEEKRPDLYVSFAGDLVERVNVRGRKYNCGLGKSIISINYDGNLYACPSLHLEAFQLGDIHSDISSILRIGSKMNEELSVDNPKSECSKCKYKYFCGGNCKARKLAMNGMYKEDLECNTIRETIDKHIATLDLE